MQARRYVIGFLLLLCSVPCKAVRTDLTVDLKEKTVSPNQPTVNIRAADTIVIRLQGEVTGLDDQDILHSFDIPSYHADSPGQESTSLYAAGRFITVSFRDCSDRILNRDLPQKLKGKLNTDACPFAVLAARDSSSWTIFANARTLAMNIFQLKAVPELPSEHVGRKGARRSLQLRHRGSKRNPSLSPGRVDSGFSARTIIDIDWTRYPTTARTPSWYAWRMAALTTN